MSVQNCTVWRWIASETESAVGAAEFGGQQLGAFHGIDPLLMFDSPPIPKDATGDALAVAMRNYWVQFAKTGDPNLPGLPKWVAYDSAAASYLELGAQIRPRAHLHQAAFDLLEHLYTKRLNGISP